MSLNWLWNKNVGTLKIEQTWTGRGELDGVHEWTLHLYEGNAFLIILWQEEPDENGDFTYSLNNFFTDKEHLKRCVQNNPDIFDDWKELTINRENYPEKKYLELIKALNKCNPKCKIILQ